MVGYLIYKERDDSSYYDFEGFVGFKEFFFFYFGGYSFVVKDDDKER